MKHCFCLSFLISQTFVVLRGQEILSSPQDSHVSHGEVT